jgi:hypothetical protein
MHTGRLQTIVTEDAGPVRICERHHDDITAFDCSHVPSHSFDHPNCFMAHDAASNAAFHFLVRPQIAPADARARDRDERIRRFDKFRIRDVFDTNVARTEHDGCAHTILPPVFVNGILARKECSSFGAPFVSLS